MKTEIRRRKAHESRADLLFSRANQQWELGKLRSAFRLFLAAAKTGDPGAQHDLGYFYDVGVGVERNRSAAIYWYGRAVHQGNSGAAYNIGTIFRDEQKAREAVKWFQQAIKLGDGDANLEIAKIYLGDRQTFKRAIEYLNRTSKSPNATRDFKEEARQILRGLKNRKGAHSHRNLPSA
jgi:TPR repeat protein